MIPCSHPKSCTAQSQSADRFIFRAHHICNKINTLKNLICPMQHLVARGLRAKRGKLVS